MMTNFRTEKIKNLEIEKISSKKLISESEQNIKERDKEIERRGILEERLKKISTVSYFENLVSPERVAGLSNKVRLRDLLDSLNDCMQINYTFLEGNIGMGNLINCQDLYLLFVD